MEPFTIAGLRARYAAGETKPREVLAEVMRRIEAWGDPSVVWIERVSPEVIEERLRELEARVGRGRGDGDDLPLFGIPFAVKDNIDMTGLPTTAACPAYAYVPTEDARAVRRLLDAGAVLVGKTNLDQFATGLVGTRSPHGAPRSVHNPEYISGGSSSGSAVAVAAGMVAFALGTDTAGSGRVPAAFNGIVGLKPTRGRVSTRGVVPACRSLDCVSVFAHTCDDAVAVLAAIEAYDPGDAYSRSRGVGTAGSAGVVASGVAAGSVEAASAVAANATDGGSFRFGVPAREHLRFFGDAESERLFGEAIDRLVSIGGEMVEIDFAPFLEAAALLYEGPWVAERDAAVGDFLRAHPSATHPVVRSIILAGRGFSATDTFRALHRLEELRRAAGTVLDGVDLLVTPTTGTIHRVEDVLAEPYALNAQLGYYTNFMNLLDLCGIAVPAGFRPNGTAFGITFIGPAFADGFVSTIGARYEAAYRRAVRPPPLVAPAGIGAWAASDEIRVALTANGTQAVDDEARAAAPVRLAVVGAHLSGEPLNHQLTGRGARLVRTCRTAPAYRLYALTGTIPPKPGLVHVGTGGAPIEIEVWEMTAEAFGSFVAEVPAPLAIGTLELEDGGIVKGFVCEPRALDGSVDITAFGGWRAYQLA